MKLLRYIFMFLMICLASQLAEAQESGHSSDSNMAVVMDSVRRQAREFASIYPDFEAGLYLRGQVDINKRGALLKYLPYLNKIASEDHYQADFIGGITFTNPNIYNHTLYSLSSQKQRFMENHIETISNPIISLNVYSQYLFSNLYSPLAYKSSRYYNFKLLSRWEKGDTTYYRISFVPRIRNFKFVDGNFVVSSGNWTIREMSFNGSMELVKYKVDVQMGKEGGQREILPEAVKISTDAGILGTRLSGTYNAFFRYDSLKVSHLVAGKGIDKYNLSMLYTTDSENLKALATSIRHYRDSLGVAVGDGAQQTLHDAAKEGKMVSDEMEAAPDTSAISESVVAGDSLSLVKKKSALAKMGSFIINDYSVDIKNFGELDILPLISPILFDFSTSNGISYTQKLRFTRVTEKDKLFYIEPRVGYNFKYSEFYWGVKGLINYAPRKMSRIYIDIGNGAKVSTDRIRNELFSLPEHVYDSTALNLKDFKTSYAKIGHKIELANGLTLGANVGFMRYSENGYSDFTLLNPDSKYVAQADKIANHSYITFVPELEITYTPHQYYYMNGERKTYLYSKYPTFSLSLAHAIKGVMKSTTRYNKLEFDMQQRLKIGPMHEFFYRAGFGIFYDYTDLYFAEFNNLRRNNLPLGWNDDIGGTFQLLPRFRYNEIDKYLRANVKYDAPLLLVPSLLRRVKYITKERLYCNFLLVDIMDPYIEMGYGIGTNIFNVGVFWGGEITRWNLVGVKFTFEVFND